MAEIIQNIENAKTWLETNPNSVFQFDQRYGAGSAKAVLDGTYGVVEEQVVEPEVKEETTDGVVKDTLKAIAQGGVEAVNELIQFGGDVAGFVESGNTAFENVLENTVGASRLYRPDRDGDGKLDIIPTFGTRAEQEAALASTGSEDKNLLGFLQTDLNFEGFGKKRSSTLGNITQSMSQFITGLIGVGKFTKLKNGKVVGGLANGFIVDATMFDPYEQNFLLALKESDFDIDIPLITEALSNKETGDLWENRLKNGLAGSVAAGTIDTVITVVRGIRLRKRAAMEVKGYGKVLKQTSEKLDASELELKDALELLDEAKPDGRFSDDGTAFKASDGTVFNTSTGKRLEEPDVNVDFKNAEKIEKMNLVEINKVSDDELRAMSLPEYSTFQKRKVDLLKGVDQTRKLNPDFDNFKLPEFSLPKGPSSEVPIIKVAEEVPVGKTGSVNKIVQTGDDVAPPLNTEIVIPKPKVTTEIPTIETSIINTKPPALKVNLTALKENLKINANRPQKFNVDELVDQIEVDNPISSYINPTSISDTDNIITIANTVARALEDGSVRTSLGLTSVAKEKEVFEAGLKEFAKLTGKSIDDLKIAALRPFKNVKNANRELIKQKLIVRYALKEVDRLASELNGLGGEINSLLEKKLIAMMELATDAITYTKATTKEIARGLQAGNIRVGVELTEETQKRLAKWGGRKRVQELAKQISDLKGNNVGKAKLLQKANKNKFWGVASEIWINSILSGFKTSALNITSNSYNLLLRPAIRATGGVLSGNGKIVEQSIREYVSIVSEVMDSIAYMTPMINSSGNSALKSALRVIKTESGVLDKATKFDFDMDTNFKGSWKMNMLGHVVRAPSRFLKGQDEFAKQLSFRSNLKATVLTDARRMSQLDFENLGYRNKAEFISGEIDKATLSKEALADKWETMVAYGRVPDEPKIRDAWIKENIGLANTESSYAAKALEEARETTFTTPLNEGLGKSTAQLVQNYPFLRMFMPFVTTPMNILRTAFERTPVLGLMTRNNLKKFLKGTPEEKAMVRGNQAYGAAVSFIF